MHSKTITKWFVDKLKDELAKNLLQLGIGSINLFNSTSEWIYIPFAIKTLPKLQNQRIHSKIIKFPRKAKGNRGLFVWNAVILTFFVVITKTTSFSDQKQFIIYGKMIFLRKMKLTLLASEGFKVHL